jgi:hypothetical protein
MRELIGAKGTISLLKAAVPKKGPISDLLPLTMQCVYCTLKISTQILKVYIAVIDSLIKGVMFERTSSRSRGTDLEI